MFSKSRAILFSALLLAMAGPALATLPSLEWATATGVNVTNNNEGAAVVEARGHISYNKTPGQGAGWYAYSFVDHDDEQCTNPYCDQAVTAYMRFKALSGAGRR